MPSGTSLPFISVFKSTRNTHGIKKGSSYSPTNTKNKNIIAASGGTLGFTTHSKARALFVVPSTPTSTLSKKQEHPRYELVLTLALLRVPMEES
ncbi:hypothetical protein ACFX15_024133 [Malus domestica]